MRGVPGVATTPCGAVRPGEACRSRRDRPGAAAGIGGAPHRPNGSSTAYTKRVEVSARLGCRARVQSLRRPVARRRRPSGQATPGQGPESFGVRGVTHRGSVAHRVVFAVSGTQTVTACCLMRTFSCLVVPRAPPSSS